MKKPKKSPTARTVTALRRLRVTLTFREIVELARDAGVKTSISHLSRIMNEGREASPALADAVESAVESLR